MSAMRNVGGVTALAAALLFGVGTPLAKLLLGPVSPWLLVGLLYLGSGIGLALWRRMRGVRSTPLGTGEGKWSAGAVLAGGVVAPVLLMWGLAQMPASGASLLLNLEAVFTALLAWFVFHENFDGRAWLLRAAPEGNGSTVTLPAAKSTIASRLNLSAEHLSRILAELTRKDETSRACANGASKQAVRDGASLFFGVHLQDNGLPAILCP